MDLTAHAYVVKGGSDAIEALMKLLEKNGVATRGNPDVHVREYTSFSMDDARTLRERATLRGTSKEGRIFVLAAPTIPADAQNALLKTFEEPPGGAKFFLIVPSPETLLPTLRSRMQTLVLENTSHASLLDVRIFLKATPEKRIELLKPFLEKGEDDKRDLSGTIAFLSELEYALGAKPKQNEIGLRAIYRARKYITDRGALAKTLLEQAALIIPKVV
jgi:DNA polymerase III delta prime subunit